MKKIIIVLLVGCLFNLYCFMTNSTVNAIGDYVIGPDYTFDENLENDEQTYLNYQNLVNKSNNKVSNLSALATNKIMNDALSNETKALLNNEFSSLQLINDEMNVEIIEENQNGNIYSSIVYDSNNDLYFYLESNGNQNNLLFYINDCKYILQHENEDYYLLSENGEKLIFIETTIVDDNVVVSDSSIQPRASWILLGENMKKTNKSWVTVLSVISTAAGATSYIVKHPVIGAISFVSGAVALVGDQLYATLYILFSQSYRSDCTSYIKEVDKYYQYSNYTGFIKSNTIYFYSTRPDYAGQNCLAYS